MLRGLVPFLKAKEIADIISNLAEEINKDYSDSEELILVCPLRGSIFFLADLVRKLKPAVQVDFVLIETEKSCKIKKDLSLDLKDKHVLIVEEIIDSGVSLTFLKERIRLAEPRSLKTVVLLDKSSRRNQPMLVDYVGRSIDDRFIVGYGMDLSEEGRNYPDMYHLGQ